MLALADDVPDVADDEEIAGHGSRQARNIIRVAGNETGGKPFCEMRGGVFGFDRVTDTAREVVRQRDVAVARQCDKTVGKIGIARCERDLDVVLNQAVVVPQQRVELDL
ncbi:hypothetical protein ACVWZK_004569 [Bradyrhizobium sp. GM0.4]